MAIVENEVITREIQEILYHFSTNFTPNLFSSEIFIIESDTICIVTADGEVFYVTIKKQDK